MTEISETAEMRTGDFSAVILVGGRSSRMGRDKARLRHPGSGRPMVEHAVELVRAAGGAEVLLSVRAGADYPEIGPEVARVLDDGEGGPLAGIAAARARARHARLLVVAVDMPNMTAHALRGLLAASTAERGAVWRGARGWEPLCAVYPAAAGAAMARAMAAGRLSLQGLISDGLKAGWMSEARAPTEGVLFNWNEPGDVTTG